MNHHWQSLVPVLLSIGVILLIAVLRAHSRTLAAITATMPLQIPLSLWIVSSADQNNRAHTLQFADSLLIGIIGTAIFTIALWLAARAGWSMVPILAASYGVWGLTVGAIFMLRSFL